MVESRQRLQKSGACLMNKNEIIEFLKTELKVGKIRKDHFPMMTNFGVRDYSETVHSLGLNYITAIGRELNSIAAISEYPVYPYDKAASINKGTNVAEDNAPYLCSTNAVRPDSIWFSKHSNKPILICEFERYEKNRKKDNKLKEKIQNLLIAYHQLGGDIPVILFVYWSYATEVAGDIEEYISIFDTGFRHTNGTFIAGVNGLKTSYLVYRCIASGDCDNLTLDQWIEAG